jgi:hypothetical protein
MPALRRSPLEQRVRQEERDVGHRDEDQDGSGPSATTSGKVIGSVMTAPRSPEHGIDGEQDQEHHVGAEATLGEGAGDECGQARERDEGREDARPHQDQEDHARRSSGRPRRRGRG